MYNFRIILQLYLLPFSLHAFCFVLYIEIDSHIIAYTSSIHHVLVLMPLLAR